MGFGNVKDLRESRSITTAGQTESSAGAEEEEENPTKVQFGRCEEEENIMFSKDDDTRPFYVNLTFICLWQTKVTPIVEGYGGWAFRMEIVPMELAYPGFGGTRWTYK
ncbi:Fe/S biogenesis protein NfuA [Striga asiatica]|uniref:Fe/S biogenesis protein NfuA n=1 Tax=Striga asiatica TaxID=4170 RepID=A0A5A7PH72_STRAF|nr:Fe/S biogenesis protein NfuA [Striga asiatica]